MATTGVAGLAWIWVLLGSSVGSLPLGGAPLPLDPVLAAAAPEECLWYGASSGLTDADPNSSNETEQLFAEPQVQQLVAEIQKQIDLGLRRIPARSAQQRALARDVPVLVRALLSRPFAMMIEDIELKEKSVEAAGAFVVNAGDQKAAIEQAIASLMKLEPSAFTAEQIAGATWQRLKLGGNTPDFAVRMGWKDNYFILCAGEQTPQQVIQRMGGSAPRWLNDVRAMHPIERESGLAYVNIAAIMQRARPLVRQEEQWDAVEKLGLTSIKAFHSVTGYDDTGCKTMGHIVTDGQRQGILSLLPYKPLSKRDLAMIPKDPMIAMALRLDGEEVMDNALRIASSFDPRAEEEFEQGLWQFQSETGIDLKRDLLGALDDVCVAYLPSGDLMSSWLSSAVAVKVKDRDRLEETVQRIVQLAQANMPRDRRRGMTIKESKLGEYKLFSMQFQGEPVPFAPAWCITDQWLVAGLLPNAVKDVLDRDPEYSLSEVEAVRQQLDTDPALLSYVDTPRLVRSVYPWVQMGLQALSGQLRREGIDIDTTALPSVEVIVRHLTPDLNIWSHESDGFHFTSHHSLPGSGNMLAAAPIGVGLALPAVQSARTAARRVQDTNNLKQIMLGCLNYESAHGHMPSNIYDEDGKALLSWRVQILPYMEAQNIYDRLHLDEPWDSDHNKQFLAMLPQVYQSTNGGQPPGKTRMLMFSGENTALREDGQATRFRDFTDGTSNTIYCVQADPEAAVDWTKPEDLPFDPKDPFRGLENNPQGFFLTAFTDGSVSTMSLGIAEEALVGFVTRSGGEIVDRNARNLPPQRRARQARDIAVPQAVPTPQ